MVEITYLQNHHGSDGYKTKGTTEEVSENVAKGLIKSKVARSSKLTLEKEDSSAEGRLTKDNKNSESK